MKRNALLQPLSREHHTALKLAKACERAALSGNSAEISSACRQAAKACTGEMNTHFAQEEQTLLPLLDGTPAQSLADKTRADHSELMAMLDGLRQNDVATLNRFGQKLSAHVRFEERELFPELEKHL
jgi:hemerythrin-like domain-containing protein